MYCFNYKTFAYIEAKVINFVLKFCFLFQKGQSPLDIAVSKKDVAVIELLCSFGSSVTIDDWALVGADVDILNKTDQKIMRTLINQLEGEAENNYGYSLSNN